MITTVPPLPQPVAKSVVAEMSAKASAERVLRKKSKPSGRRQRADSPKVLCVRFCAAATDVTVLMVATEAAEAAPIVTLDGSKEQLAYWPGLTGVQLRTTAPVYPFRGVRDSL